MENVAKTVNKEGGRHMIDNCVSVILSFEIQTIFKTL